MTAGDLLAVVAGASIGAMLGAWGARRRISEPPERLMRVNVRGARVPAVLGEPVAGAGLVALAVLAAAGAAGWDPAVTGRTGLAAAIVIVVMTAAGALDDRRGDETSRGFKGHLGALRSGKLTGGVLKIAAGGIAGLGAGLALFADDPPAVIATAALVALGANAVNLFDRAPGRAAKVFLVVALPLMVIGDGTWAVAVAGVVGALAACLPHDLGETAMLGDAGANPLGALLGLGLALSLGGPGRWVAVMVLVVLNGASERWSFSRAIESTPWLERLDRIGRK